MKDNTVILLVIGGLVLLFWAMSKGLLGTGATGLAINPATGQPYGAISVPQPSTNYSGYLAASTAPGVANALNGALTGLSSMFAGWLGTSSTPTPAPAQGANPASPSLAAQPSGPTSSFYSGASAPAMLDATQYAANVGPSVPPDISYNATQGAAFDFPGLTADNAYDPSYSLS